MNGIHTTISIDFTVPRLSEVVNSDAEDELTSWLRRLESDRRFAAMILGCEVEEVPFDAETRITVDFGHPPVH